MSNPKPVKKDEPIKIIRNSNNKIQPKTRRMDKPIIQGNETDDSINKLRKRIGSNKQIISNGTDITPRRPPSTSNITPASSISRKKQTSDKKNQNRQQNNVLSHGERYRTETVGTRESNMGNIVQTGPSKKQYMSGKSRRVTSTSQFTNAERRFTSSYRPQQSQQNKHVINGSRNIELEKQKQRLRQSKSVPTTPNNINYYNQSDDETSDDEQKLLNKYKNVLQKKGVNLNSNTLNTKPSSSGVMNRNDKINLFKRQNNYTNKNSFENESEEFETDEEEYSDKNETDVSDEEYTDEEYTDEEYTNEEYTNEEYTDKNETDVSDEELLEMIPKKKLITNIKKTNTTVQNNSTKTTLTNRLNKLTKKTTKTTNTPITTNQKNIQSNNIQGNNIQPKGIPPDQQEIKKNSNSNINSNGNNLGISNEIEKKLNLKQDQFEKRIQKMLNNYEKKTERDINQENQEQNVITDLYIGINGNDNQNDGLSEKTPIFTLKKALEIANSSKVDSSGEIFIHLLSGVNLIINDPINIYSNLDRYITIEGSYQLKISETISEVILEKNYESVTKIAVNKKLAPNMFKNYLIYFSNGLTTRIIENTESVIIVAGSYTQDNILKKGMTFEIYELINQLQFNNKTIFEGFIKFNYLNISTSNNNNINIAKQSKIELYNNNINANIYTNQKIDITFDSCNFTKSITIDNNSNINYNRCIINCEQNYNNCYCSLNSCNIQNLITFNNTTMNINNSQLCHKNINLLGYSGILNINSSKFSSGLENKLNENCIQCIGTKIHLNKHILFEFSSNSALKLDGCFVTGNKTYLTFNSHNKNSISNMNALLFNNTKLTLSDSSINLNGNFLNGFKLLNNSVMILNSASRIDTKSEFKNSIFYISNSSKLLFQDSEIYIGKITSLITAFHILNESKFIFDSTDINITSINKFINVENNSSLLLLNNNDIKRKMNIMTISDAITVSDNSLIKIDIPLYISTMKSRKGNGLVIKRCSKINISKYTFIHSILKADADVLILGGKKYENLPEPQSNTEGLFDDDFSEDNPEGCSMWLGIN